MPINRPCLRFHLEHQTAPSWPSEIVTHRECERHLRKLSQTACGCMRYGNSIRRPYARIDMASGLSTETNIARLFLTMSADQPLQGADYACHRCSDPMCAHPDHLRIGTHHSNILDKFYPPRRIKPRKAARFYDDLLLEIGDQPPEPTRKAVHNRRPKHLVAATPIPPGLAEHLKVPHPSIMGLVHVGLPKFSAI